MSISQVSVETTNRIPQHRKQHQPVRPFIRPGTGSPPLGMQRPAHPAHILGLLGVTVVTSTIPESVRA